MAFVPCIGFARAQALSASLVLWAALSSGCGGGAMTPEECAELGTSAERDNCCAEIAVEVVREDPIAGEEMVASIEDDTIRDFVYLTLTREVDPSTPRWCALIVEPALASRCRVLVSRPHLHRELLGGDGGPGGGPPPGGQGGPPPGGMGGPPPGGQGGPPPGGQGGPPPGGQGGPPPGGMGAPPPGGAPPPPPPQ